MRITSALLIAGIIPSYALAQDAPAVPTPPAHSTHHVIDLVATPSGQQAPKVIHKRVQLPNGEATITVQASDVVVDATPVHAIPATPIQAARYIHNPRQQAQPAPQGAPVPFVHPLIPQQAPNMNVKVEINNPSIVININPAPQRERVAQPVKSPAPPKHDRAPRSDQPKVAPPQAPKPAKPAGGAGPHIGAAMKMIQDNPELMKSITPLLQEAFKAIQPNAPAGATPTSDAGPHIGAAMKMIQDNPELMKSITPLLQEAFKSQLPKK